MTVAEWLINGAALETGALAVSDDSGLQETPEPREADVVIPGMDGELDIGMDPTAPRRSVGPGKITFSGWVKGVDPDTGRLGWGDTWEMYLARVDELVAMFAPRTLQIDHVRPDGTRRAVGRVVGSIAPTRERTSPVLGRFKVVVKIPGAWWAALDPVTTSGTVSTGGAIALDGLGVGNAPITDAEIVFGPGSNPTLVQSGTFLAYDGVISSGRQLTVDVGRRELGVGSGTSWTPAESSIRYGPGARWFDLDPTAGSLALNHTGGGSMFVSVTGHPKYKTS